MRTNAIVPALALAVLAGLGSVGCSKQLQHAILPNQLPTVRLTWAPIETQSKIFYSYNLKWVGDDPDGRVVSYEYAVNPLRGPGGVIDWTLTKESSKTLKAVQWGETTASEADIKFVVSTPESAFQQLPVPRSEDFQVFAIRAVDDRGDFSEPVERAFYSFGVAPIAQILDPVPQDQMMFRTTPAVRIAWEGRDFIDPYGYAFERPLYYKYRLFKRGNDGVHWDDWIKEPDSLRREFAPGFDKIEEGETESRWKKVGSDTTEVQFTDLQTNSEYLFVVVAFGRSGAYSPIFSLRRNMLQMTVGFAGQGGPKITLFNSFFQYTYKGGGYSLDPSAAIQVQAPAGVPVTFNWFAVPAEGSIMRRYRWVLDLVALDDETPRTDQKDWYHWSPWNQTTSTTIGPFVGSEGDTGDIHNFYLEAEDINGMVSLGWVQFRIYRPTFDRRLLIVNDTRFPVDGVVSRTQLDTLRLPTGVWPSSAELDTFLFAVGGVRWRMKPPGSLSPQGLFRGYSYDTLGTRLGRSIPTVPLGLLGHYQHIVWMANSAVSYDQPPNSSTLPSQTLLYMSGRNRQNTLSTWVNQGGELWGLGGGFANATSKPWNLDANDVPSTTTYNSLGNGPDLLPGMFMFDLVHWRSEFRTYESAFPRFSRYDQQDPTVVTPPPAPAWSGGTFTNPEVDYSTLPTTLQFRGTATEATDPVSGWPGRTTQEYYVGNKFANGSPICVEYLCGENRILEQLPAHPGTNDESTVERSALDTLYLVYAPTLQRQFNQSSAGGGVNAVMTYYHGRENSSVVFSGMNIWDFRRQDCLGLVDFVLGRLWGLQKSTLYTAPRVVAPSFARRVAVPTLQQPPRRLPGVTRQPVGTSTPQRRR